MELSNTTLMAGVNTVLENLGERRQLSLTSPVSRKCVQALSDSLTDIASLHDWEFTRANILANSWLVDEADLGDVQRIHNVSYGSLGTGYVQLPWVDLEAYNSYPVQAARVGERGRFYTISGYNRVRVSPYPLTPEEQAMYFFTVTRSLTMPVLDTDKFPIPERLLSLLIYKTCSYMSISHLDDQNAAAMWDRQFTNLLLQVRNRERGLPPGGISIFKLRNRRRW